LRRYFYTIKRNMRDEETRYHLYITAKRRFSFNEMLAKQHWVLAHLDELPFNDITVKIGSCREGSTQIVALLEPISSAFHYDYVRINKLKRHFEIWYDFVLEFVFTEKEHVEVFLEWIRKKWKGEWKEDEEV